MKKRRCVLVLWTWKRRPLFIDITAASREERLQLLLAGKNKAGWDRMLTGCNFLFPECKAVTL